MGLRLAIGSGKCSDYVGSRDPIVRELCNRLTLRISSLRSLPVSQLLKLPKEATEVERLHSRRVEFTTFLDLTEAGVKLVVVQGFLPSWRHARYFGTVGVGLMLAEGLLLLPEGTEDAPDDVMWGYR